MGDRAGLGVRLVGLVTAGLKSKAGNWLIEILCGRG